MMKNLKGIELSFKGVLDDINNVIERNSKISNFMAGMYVGQLQVLKFSGFISINEEMELSDKIIDLGVTK
jgi:hypothetical protein